MTFWERQNPGESEKISGCQGVGRGKDKQVGKRFSPMKQPSCPGLCSLFQLGNFFCLHHGTL